jgi:hypothetical protein
VNFFTFMFISLFEGFVFEMSHLYVEFLWARSWQGLFSLCRMLMVVCLSILLGFSCGISFVEVLILCFHNRRFLEHLPCLFCSFRNFPMSLEHLSQGSHQLAGEAVCVCWGEGLHTIVTLSSVYLATPATYIFVFMLLL